MLSKGRSFSGTARITASETAKAKSTTMSAMKPQKRARLARKGSSTRAAKRYIGVFSRGGAGGSSSRSARWRSTFHESHGVMVKATTIDISIATGTLSAIGLM